MILIVSWAQAGFLLVVANPVYFGFLRKKILLRFRLLCIVKWECSLSCAMYRCGVLLGFPGLN